MVTRDRLSEAIDCPLHLGVTEAGPLRIVNYPDYVNPDVIADFEAAYGVTVEITTFDTDTEATTKLASGAVKADIHHSMVTQSVSNLIAAGLLQPLNRSYLTNFGNVIPTFNDPWYDKGAAYTVPYMFFGTGIGYRTDRIDPAEVEAQGWDALWNATGFKGEVSVLDDVRETIAMALLRNGVDRVYCVPGESYLAALDALHDTPEIALHVTRNDGGASYMADAHGKLTGKPGILFGQGSRIDVAGLERRHFECRTGVGCVRQIAPRVEITP